MRYNIILAPGAVEDMRKLRAYDRKALRKSLEVHLRHNPASVSKSPIKRLRGLQRPEYRLRVGKDLRVYYDVTGTTVEVLAIMTKRESLQWLGEKGEAT